MSRTLPLTEQQERLWRFIQTCERSPSYDEMAAFMGLHSKSGIERIVSALRAKGFVHYIPNRTRSIVAINPELDLAGIPSATLAAELARRLAG